MKPANAPVSLANTLICSNCQKSYVLSQIQTFATCCNKPLLAVYDTDAPLKKEVLAGRGKTMWRYAEMLPVQDEKNIVSLGEGMTPVLRLSQLEKKYGFSSLLLKDESYNPTGSFKARGISVAVSRMKELGIEKCIIPTAGNAGGALAAYCAKAQIHCTVVMPRHTPAIFKKECSLYGAQLVLVDGLIDDCAKKANEINQDKSYFDLSTLKEPYRLEGKKTMGYEIAEQGNWQLPEAIIYPAGGGTGLIGIWKAFQEMIALGWIRGALPKMIAVQAANCAPVWAARADPENWKKTFHPYPSIANGLAVPYPFGMDLMQKVITESGGDVVTVSEKEISEGIGEVAQSEGILLSPEGSAVWKALAILVKKASILPHNRILLLNTGSGYKYLDNTP
jgi:threonine synthase